MKAESISPVQWARRSMPLSSAAMSALEAAEPCQIGIALPLDPASASLALWLVERGFSVIFLADAKINYGLISALEEAGVAGCDTREELLAGKPELVLDTDGNLLTGLSGSAKGGTMANLELAPEHSAIDRPAIHLGASPLFALATSHGVGQATVSGFLDITNLQIAGSKVLVIGYGLIGEGVALYARGYGARVMVVEADPVRAFAAIQAGHEVTQMDEVLCDPILVINALEHGAALTLGQLDKLPDGVFLTSATANPDAFALSDFNSAKPQRDHVTEYSLASGRKIRLICEGQPTPIATGQGLPLEYADIQIAAQIRAIAELLDPHQERQAGIRPISNAIEADIALRALRESEP